MLGKKRLVEFIKITNSKFEISNIKKIIIADDLEKQGIGDICVYLHRLRQKLIYLNNPTFSILCRNNAKIDLIKQITKNIDFWNIQFIDNWNHTNFAIYDLLLINGNVIDEMINYLYKNYYTLFLNEQFKASIFINVVTLKNVSQISDKKNIERIMEEINFEFIDSILERNGFPVLSQNASSRALVVNEEERSWANLWLEKTGISTNTSLIILLDITQRREKMLTKKNFAKLISWFCSFDDTKVLLFDETSSNRFSYIFKNQVTDLSSKIIVAEGLSIRETMCLIASKYTKAVIGPCTGLMHLTNDIYTHYLNRKIIEEDELPFLLVYTGYQNKYYNPWHWWDETLVSTIALVKSRGKKKVINLNECPNNQKLLKITLPVKELEAKMLIDFISEK